MIITELKTLKIVQFIQTIKIIKINTHNKEINNKQEIMYKVNFQIQPEHQIISKRMYTYYFNNNFFSSNKLEIQFKQIN